MPYVPSMQRKFGEKSGRSIVDGAGEKGNSRMHGRWFQLT
jgi:hypothetical protein